MGTDLAPVARGNPAWKPGVSGNPAGRPIGSRQKIAEAIIRDLTGAWEKHGAVVLERLAVEDPGKFAALAAGMIPREFQVTLTPALPANLDNEDWAALVGLVRAIKTTFPHAGALKADAVCAHVSAALAAYDASPILDATVATT